MKCSAIIIGDEMLCGQVADTNSADIARSLAAVGWRLAEVRVVADTAEAIERAVATALADGADVVLTTGGLGPTRDDVTKHTLARMMHMPLVEDPAVRRNVERVFAARHLAMNALTATQALVPQGCTVLPNEVGTAPIMWFDTPGGAVVVAMPGVPFEMRRAFSGHVLPRLLERFPPREALVQRTLVLVDIPESRLAGEIAPWEEEFGDNLHLAYLPSPGYLRLRIDSRAATPDEAARRADSLVDRLCRRYPENVIATADLTPAEILVERLRARGLTLATAESCTGGNIAHRLTMLAGVSEVYVGGVVSYSNEVKVHALGVSPDTLATWGAVSEQTVGEMARGAAHRLGACCAVATSGIAGPTGATPGKPVGTVCIGIYINTSATGSERAQPAPAQPAPGSERAQPDTYAERLLTFTHNFPGDRARVIDRATTTALLTLARLLPSSMLIHDHAKSAESRSDDGLVNPAWS